MARYGKPVIVPSSDSTAASDAGTGTGSDAEETFPASYQAPLAGLMGKGDSAVSFLHENTQNLNNAADRDDDKGCALALTPVD